MSPPTPPAAAPMPAPFLPPVSAPMPARAPALPPMMSSSFPTTDDAAAPVRRGVRRPRAQTRAAGASRSVKLDRISARCRAGTSHAARPRGGWNDHSARRPSGSVTGTSVPAARRSDVATCPEYASVIAVLLLQRLSETGFHIAGTRVRRRDCYRATRGADGEDALQEV